MANHYTEEFKKQVIQQYENGSSIHELSEKYHIASSTLYHWRKEHCSIQTPTQSYTPSDFHIVLKRLKKLEHKIEIISLTGFIKEVPLKKKLESLENLYHCSDTPYSVHELCEALGVSRGTFYNHILRRADHSLRDAKQSELMRQVQQIFDDSQQRFGAEKIRIILAENGIRVGHRRVAAIMDELGLKSVRPEAKKQYNKIQHSQRKNLLKRDFSAEHPNQIWVSDITYFRISGNPIYLCVILDLYSRRVIGYRISKNASTNLLNSTFRIAFENRGRPQGLTFHSDRGTQYTSAAFSQLLLQSKVQQSFSAPGSPLDNAVAETFFATFKKEEAYRRDYTSERSFYKSVDEYMLFYNELRPHRTLKYKTPKAFEELYKNSEKKCSNIDHEEK